MIEGQSSRGAEVLIRSVDDGEILFTRGYELGRRVYVAPGSHKLSVMCRKHFDYGSKLVGSVVTVNAVPGNAYMIEIESFRMEPLECDVRVRAGDAV